MTNSKQQTNTTTTLELLTQDALHMYFTFPTTNGVLEFSQFRNETLQGKKIGALQMGIQTAVSIFMPHPFPHPLHQIPLSFLPSPAPSCPVSESHVPRAQFIKQPFFLLFLSLPLSPNSPFSVTCSRARSIKHYMWTTIPPPPSPCIPHPLSHMFQNLVHQTCGLLPPPSPYLHSLQPIP